MLSANCYDTRLLDERQGDVAMFNKVLIFRPAPLYPPISSPEMGG